MAPVPESLPSGWDAHVHVFDAAAPVRPGHYRPGHHPLEAIEAVAAAHGIGHLVLVQPSVYGTDNGVLLRALEARSGRHRGVVVVDPAIADAELERLHRAGVRGVRFNLVSPTGHVGDPAGELRALAPRLRALGWHVQWYVPHARLPDLVRWQAETGLCFVLDHLGDLRADLAEDHPDCAALQALADGGAWVKLSGWYRLGAVAPYGILHPLIARVASGFGPRTVWGSDWPHTGQLPQQLPDYDSLMKPVSDACGTTACDQVLRDHARALYGA